MSDCTNVLLFPDGKQIDAGYTTLRLGEVLVLDGVAYVVDEVRHTGEVVDGRMESLGCMVTLAEKTDELEFVCANEGHNDE